MESLTVFKVCPQCGEEFKTYRRAAIYCGNACHNASQVRAKTYACDQCGQDFQRPNNAIKRPAKRRFCSRECHTEWKRANRNTAHCVVCGSSYNVRYTGQQACSGECRRALITTAQELTCEACGRSFRAFASEVERGRRYCSNACAKRGMIGPNHPNWRGGRVLAHGRMWQEIRQRVIERDKVCRLCGAERSPSGRSLHVHHVHARRNYLIIDVANDLSNLVALCASCHTKVEQAVIHGRTADLPKWLKPQE